MPEIKEVPFLKGSDVNKETIVTFLAPHEEISADESGVDRELQQILIELPDKSKKIWTMNRTSQRMLVGLLGSNSDEWVGKQVTIYSVDQNVKGQFKAIIYVKGVHK